jgi:hypothetical protein
MSRELTSTEFGMWNARLQYADEVWKRAGLHDQSPADVHARRSINYYRGDQADGIGFSGIPGSLGVIDNVSFSTMNVLVANLYARNPQTDVRATRQDQMENANRQERLVNHLVTSPRLRMKRELNRVLWDAVVLKFGVVRHGFTVAPEKVDRSGNLLDLYDPARPDFPWIRRTAPWDFRGDPTGETLHPEHMAWCAFRDLYPMSTIRSSPAFIARQNLKPTRTLNDAKFHESQKLEYSPDEMELVECWRIYDKVKRETFVLSPGCPDKAISTVNPWPIPSWRTLPCNVLQFNPTPDDPMGVSFSELTMPLQDDLNRCLTLALELAKRQRRMIFYNPSNLVDGEESKLDNLSLMEMIACQDVNSVVREVQVGGNYQELLILARYIRDEIRILLGVGEMERGQRINVETAAEANQVGAGAAVQRGRNQGPFEDFLADVIETFALGVQDTLTEEFAVPILGGEDANALFAPTQGSPFETVTPESIRGDFLYRVRPGSTLPYDPDMDIRRQLAFNAAMIPFGEAVNQLELIVDTTRVFEKDPSKIAVKPEILHGMMKSRAQAQMAGMETNQNPQGGGDAGGGDKLAKLAKVLGGPNGGRPVQ